MNEDKNGVRIPKFDWREVDRLLRAKNKIDAIKHFRAITGLSLKTSKDAVDQRAGALELESRKVTFDGTIITVSQWSEIRGDETMTINFSDVISICRQG